MRRADSIRKIRWRSVGATCYWFVKNGMFVLLLWLVALPAQAEQLSCSYLSKRDGSSLEWFSDCGSLSGNQLEVPKQHLQNLEYDNQGLGCVMVHGGRAFYLRDDGRSQEVFSIDTYCDQFEHGLARGIVAGKMVFINPQLDIVLAPGFDFADSFWYGYAKVCNGPFGKEQIGELSFRTGGQCGLINRQGALVLPANYAITGEEEVFQRYRDTHNDCPQPPVTTEQGALCHVRRHLENMERDSSNWKDLRIFRQGDEWHISFVLADEPEDELQMIVNVANPYTYEIDVKPVASSR